MVSTLQDDYAETKGFDADGTFASTFTRDLFAWLRQVAADADLPPNAFRLAFFISQYVNRGTGTAWPSQGTLAMRMGATPRTIRTLSEALAEAGHIALTSGQSRHVTCTYEPVLK